MLVHCAHFWLTSHIPMNMKCRYILRLEGIKMIEKHVTNIYLAIQTMKDLGKSIVDNEPLHRFQYEWFGFTFAGHKSR